MTIADPSMNFRYDELRAFLVDESDGPVPRVGVRLASVDFVGQTRRIVERHRARYPDLPLADDILRAAALPTESAARLTVAT